MVLLAIFAFDLLPIRYTAVLLLIAAMVLLILEAKVGGHGALAIAGIVCLTFGTLTLVAAPVPELRVSPWVAISVSLAFGGITWFLVSLAWRARRRKSRLGVDAMVGATATAMEALAPNGHVLVEGDLASRSYRARPRRHGPARGRTRRDAAAGGTRESTGRQISELTGRWCWRAVRSTWVAPDHGKPHFPQLCLGLAALEYNPC